MRLRELCDKIDGSKIVAITEHKGNVIIVTEDKVFRGNFMEDVFVQCFFEVIKEDEE